MTIFVSGAKDLANLLSNLEKFVVMCEKHKLLIKLSKIQFGTTVKLVDHILSERGWQIYPTKVDALSHFPDLTQLPDKEAYDMFTHTVGMLRFLQEYLEDLGRDLQPFNQKTSKKRKWSWTTTERKEMERILGKVSKEITLSIPDPEKTFFLQTDWSLAGVGGMLYQSED